MLQDLALIRQMHLLEDLETDEIYRYLSEGQFTISRYGQDSIVHFSGEHCTKLELILEGKVVIERIDEAGNLMVIADFSEGDILGGNLLFSKNPYYPMMISAKEPTTMLEIGRENLFQMFQTNFAFLRRYLEFVSDHATILGDTIKSHVNLTIRESVLNYLDYEEKRQDSKVIQLNMTKKALAEKIGVQRTSLQRELAKMRADGLLEFDAETITRTQ